MQQEETLKCSKKPVMQKLYNKVALKHGKVYKMQQETLKLTRTERKKERKKYWRLLRGQNGL
mgnify:CR=1 FL=1